MVNRLNRIEGQVRGLKNMLDNGAYSTDVLIQTSAVKAALNSFSKELFAEYVNNSVIDKIKTDDEYIVAELIDTFYKLAK